MFKSHYLFKNDILPGLRRRGHAAAPALWNAHALLWFLPPMPLVAAEPSSAMRVIMLDMVTSASSVPPEQVPPVYSPSLSWPLHEPPETRV